MKGELRGSKKGQSIVEFLIALSVLTLALSAAIIAIFGGKVFTVDSVNAEQALFMARENLEQAQALAREDYISLTNSVSTNGIFTREIIVTDAGADTRKVVSRVSWNTNRPQKVELTSLVTDWFNSQQLGGDTGGGSPSGDWKNPLTLGSIQLQTAAATDLDVFQKYVYMTATHSQQEKEDFFIINATNGTMPVIMSSLNLGKPLNAIDVAGAYAYAVGDDGNEQLQIISIANRSAPTSTKRLKLTGTSAKGISIFYSGTRIYAGTEASGGKEFHIIDVSAPASPTILAQVEINHAVNDIYVRGDVAYLATSDDAEELKIYNISNLASIAKIGGFNAPGNQDGLTLFNVGTKLYLGRAQGNTSPTIPDFYIIDISNPSAVSVLGSKVFEAKVNGMFVREKLAFIGTDVSNREFQIYEVSNPAAIQFYKDYNFAQVARGIDYEDNLVYVATKSQNNLRIITSNP